MTLPRDNQSPTGDYLTRTRFGAAGQGDTAGGARPRRVGVFIGLFLLALAVLGYFLAWPIAETSAIAVFAAIFLVFGLLGKPRPPMNIMR